MKTPYWYLYLVSGVDSNGKTREKRNVLLENHIFQEGNMIISLDVGKKGAKNFTFFDNLDLFINWYLSPDITVRNFYEVIPGEHPQKPHFDIDIPRNVKDTEEPTEFVEEIVVSIVSVFKSQFAIELDRKLIWIYSSHGPEKWSYHIVVDGYCHSNNHQALLFYRRVVALMKLHAKKKIIDPALMKLPPNQTIIDPALMELHAKQTIIDPKVIDANVYSRTQSFRLLFSSKLGTNRIKTTRYLEVTEENGKKVMELSLISYCINCVRLPNLEMEKVRSETRPNEIINMTPEMYDNVDKKLGVFFGGEHPFNIQPQGDHIYLSRQKPFGCPLHKTQEDQHTSNNACIYFWNNQIKFVCYAGGEPYLYKFLGDYREAVPEDDEDDGKVPRMNEEAMKNDPFSLAKIDPSFTPIKIVSSSIGIPSVNLNSFSSTFFDSLKTLRNGAFATDPNYQWQQFEDEINRNNAVTQGRFNNRDVLIEKMRKVFVYCSKDKLWYDFNDNKISKVSTFSLSDYIPEFFNGKDYIKESLADILKGNWDKFNRERVVFLPYDQHKDADPHPNLINLFIGYRVKFASNDELIKPYLDHLKIVWCNNDEKVYHYIIQWLADIFQNPTNRSRCAIVLVGQEGIGKGIGTDPIANIMKCGDYFCQEYDMERLTGKFNRETMNKMLILLNEVNGKNKHDMNKLKSIIADTNERAFEGKGLPTIYGNTYTRYIFTSNDEDAFKLSPGDRHFLVLKCSPKYKGIKAYFDKMDKLTNSQDFLNALWSFLVTVDLSTYNGSVPVMTEAKMSMVNHYPHVIDEFLADLDLKTFVPLDDGNQYDDKDPEIRIPIKEAYEGYVKWKKSNGKGQYCKFNVQKTFTDYIKKNKQDSFVITTGTNRYNFLSHKRTEDLEKISTSKILQI